MSKRVVITGQGTVTAFGETWEDNKTKICELKNAVRHSAGCIFRLFRVIIEITIPINEHNGPQNMTSI